MNGFQTNSPAAAAFASEIAVFPSGGIIYIPATKAAHEAVIVRLEEELALHRAAFEEMWSVTAGSVVSASEIAVPTAAPTTMPGFQAYEQEPIIPWVDFGGDAAPVLEAPEGAQLGPLLGIRAQEGAIATVRISGSGEGTHTRWTYDPRTNSLAAAVNGNVCHNRPGICNSTISEWTRKKPTMTLTVIYESLKCTNSYFELILNGFVLHGSIRARVRVGRPLEAEVFLEVAKMRLDSGNVLGVGSPSAEGG
ncbi:hypothetical protein NLJ89_g6472 [Agrocybe chaxingu]|uniref:Uncharacterized protein n=1 Tax=Agrocybe chaxingu TaxID=84603 RepID=A0A9W8MVZ3_9AGAR|nr:hypothetical protein NLJ89_g6472 [Agrocybe chaxingu]